MKFRNGFVSNSSSSSFLIYGVCLTDEELEAALGPDVDAWSHLRKAGLNYEHPDYCGHYVGLSWDAVGDDETGAQFKERARQALSAAGIDLTDKTVGSWSEAWYDG